MSTHRPFSWKNEIELCKKHKDRQDKILVKTSESFAAKLGKKG